MRDLAKDRALVDAIKALDIFADDYLKTSFVVEANQEALPYWMDQYEIKESEHQSTLIKLRTAERIAKEALSRAAETVGERNILRQENERLKRRVEKFSLAFEKYLIESPPYEHKTMMRRALDSLKGE